MAFYDKLRLYTLTSLYNSKFKNRALFLSLNLTQRWSHLWFSEITISLHRFQSTLNGILRKEFNKYFEIRIYIRMHRIFCDLDELSFCDWNSSAHSIMDLSVVSWDWAKLSNWHLLVRLAILKQSFQTYLCQILQILF